MFTRDAFWQALFVIILYAMIACGSVLFYTGYSNVEKCQKVHLPIWSMISGIYYTTFLIKIGILYKIFQLKIQYINAVVITYLAILTFVGITFRYGNYTSECDQQILDWTQIIISIQIFTVGYLFLIGVYHYFITRNQVIDITQDRKYNTFGDV